jgi:L-threonylcarbamoyladenylate synthase
VTVADIEAVLGRPLAASPAGGDRPLSPGMLESHYAPRAALRLDATDIARGEALLAFGATLPAGHEHAAAVEQLSSAGDVVEAATRLFAALRNLDRTGAVTIAVAPIPDTGLGATIRDRLARAAAGRG